MQAPPPGYSNYPRYAQGPQPVPPGPPVVRFESLSEAFALMREEWGTWALAALILLILSVAIGLPLEYVVNLAITGKPDAPVYGDSRFWLVNAVHFLVSQGFSACFTAGMLGMCVKRLRGEAFNYTDIFVGIPRFLTYLGAGLLTSLLVAVGLVLCIVPGLWLMGCLIFAPLVVLDQKAGAIEAIQISYTTLSKHGLAMFALIFIAGILMLAGLLACCVGILFTMPIYYFVIAIHYHAFFPPQGGPEVAAGAPVAPQFSV